MWIEAACCGSYVLSATVGVVRYMSLQRFLAQYSSASNETFLVQYGKLTRNQTRLVYTGAAFLLGGLLTGAVTILRHGMAGLVVWLLVKGIVLGIGFNVRGLEKKVRSLPRGSEMQAEEYRRLTGIWAKNTLS
jgi:VIT1/CCC1 family predicted Fe2+/Mn2+ transporter